MPEPLTITAPVLQDTELQALAICASAIERLRDTQAQARVAQYLMDRFGGDVVEAILRGGKPDA